MPNTGLLNDKVKQEQVGRAIGRIASGVNIVTLERSGEKDGMLTTWIEQCAFEPPMLTVAVKKDRPILAKLSKDSPFAVNVLSKKNMDIFKNFAKPYTDGLNRFENLVFDKDNHGNPIFPGSVAYLACVVRQQVEAGDHFVIIGEIIDGGLLTGDAEPMIHLRSNGFQY